MRLARSEIDLSIAPRTAAPMRGTARATENGLYVQYGCGLCAPEGWLNFDASPRLRIERVPGLRTVLHATVGILFPPAARMGDIVRGLPVPGGTARGVYCSHVLEHLPRDEVPVALRNTLRLLQPGGIFRLVVPDLEWRAKRYLSDAAKADPLAADGFFQRSNLGTRRRPRTPIAALASLFGNSAHLWMYDFAALAFMLDKAGFSSIRRCAIGDSGDPMFAQVEEADRFTEAGESELAIEARRPA
jgi:SAM-dependent methyltransferase